MTKDRAIIIVERLFDEGHINIREKGTLRRAILLPKPKGNWIEEYEEAVGALNIRYKSYKCSKCGWSSSLVIPRRFCPNCGDEKANNMEVKFGEF